MWHTMSSGPPSCGGSSPAPTALIGLLPWPMSSTVGRVGASAPPGSGPSGHLAAWLPPRQAGPTCATCKQVGPRRTQRRHQPPARVRRTGTAQRWNSTSTRALTEGAQVWAIWSRTAVRLLPPVEPAALRWSAPTRYPGWRWSAAMKSSQSACLLCSRSRQPPSPRLPSGPRHAETVPGQSGQSKLCTGWGSPQWLPPAQPGPAACAVGSWLPG